MIPFTYTDLYFFSVIYRLNDIFRSHQIYCLYYWSHTICLTKNLVFLHWKTLGICIGNVYWFYCYNQNKYMTLSKNCVKKILIYEIILNRTYSLLCFRQEVPFEIKVSDITYRSLPAARRPSVIWYESCK